MVDNKTNTPEEIDLTGLDWNNLSPDEFKALNDKMLKNSKLAKSQNKKKERASGFVTVSLRGNYYSIKLTEYQRLKSLRSQKSKDKLIDKIISTTNVLETL